MIKKQNDSDIINSEYAFSLSNINIEMLVTKIF